MNSKKILTCIIIALTLISMNVPQGHALVNVIVSGTITDQSTGKPIAGATVNVYPPQRGGIIIIGSIPAVVLTITNVLPIGTATTNAAGVYSIPLNNLVERYVYTVRASKTTYTTNTGEFVAPYVPIKIPIPMNVNIALSLAPIAPIAVINGPYKGKIGDVIQFSSAGSNDPDGTITAYQWDFGDSSFSTQANPTHAYGSQQIFAVKLTVTDNSGATNTATTSCTIIAPKDPLAEANGPYSVMVGDTLNVTSVGSSDPDGTIVEYRWDFGDGSGYSFDLNSSHVYSTDGNFTITLRVKDDDGRTHEDTAQVNITPLPIDPVADNVGTGIVKSPVPVALTNDVAVPSIVNTGITISPVDVLPIVPEALNVGIGICKSPDALYVSVPTPLNVGTGIVKSPVALYVSSPVPLNVGTGISKLPVADIFCATNPVPSNVGTGMFKSPVPT